MSVRADLAAGFGLLTRFPVGWLVAHNPPFRPARAVWTYPLAGAALGGVTAAALAVGHWLALPPLLAAAWALGATTLATGGLHEDGLADTADGFGGGRTPARRLEIMRDSRIGSYGALALLLSLAIRLAAVAAIAARMPGPVMACALVAAGALSRGAMLPALAWLRPARPDGLGHGLGRVEPMACLLGVAIALAAAAGLLPPLRALAACLGAGLTAAVVAVIAQRRIGGYTGDVLGAIAVVAECVVLSVLAAG